MIFFSNYIGHSWLLFCVRENRKQFICCLPLNRIYYSLAAPPPCQFRTCSQCVCVPVHTHAVSFLCVGVPAPFDPRAEPCRQVPCLNSLSPWQTWTFLTSELGWITARGSRAECSAVCLPQAVDVCAAVLCGGHSVQQLAHGSCCQTGSGLKQAVVAATVLHPSQSTLLGFLKKKKKKV